MGMSTKSAQDVKEYCRLDITIKIIASGMDYTASARIAKGKLIMMYMRKTRIKI